MYEMGADANVPSAASDAGRHWAAKARASLAADPADLSHVANQAVHEVNGTHTALRRR